jgi:O-antigen ligase
MNTFYNQIKIFSTLFFFPLSYIVGIAITEIFIFFFIIFLIINFHNEKFLNKNIFFVLSVFSLYLAINAIIQIPSSLKYSSIFHIRYVLFAISVFSFFKIYEHSQINKKLFFMIFVILIIVLLFDSCFQFFVGENILGQKLSRFGYRVSSFFGDELILGSFLMRLLPILLWYLFYLKIDFNSKKILSIIFFSVYFFVIYISGERTSFALTILMILSFIIFVSNLRYIFISSLIVFIIFVSLVAFTKIGNEDITHRIFVKTYKQLVNKNEDTNKVSNNVLANQNLKFADKIKNLNIFSPDHHGHLIIAKKLFTESYIFGVGPKGFRHYCRSVNYDPPKGICSTHPHNILAQILSELGIVGLLFYLIFTVFILKIFFTNIRKRLTNNEINGLLVISIGLLINLFPFIPSGNLFNNWISSFIYFKIGLFIFSYNKLPN